MARQFFHIMPLQGSIFGKSICGQTAHTEISVKIWNFFKKIFFQIEAHMCLMCAHTANIFQQPRVHVEGQTYPSMKEMRLDPKKI